jgi:hypothetical protein
VPVLGIMQKRHPFLKGYLILLYEYEYSADLGATAPEF